MFPILGRRTKKRSVFCHRQKKIRADFSALIGFANVFYIVFLLNVCCKNQYRPVQSASKNTGSVHSSKNTSTAIGVIIGYAAWNTR